tara:strand:- start:3065 stop:3310 length:246 start_codon:yes stop_codon:yes gene_type:complete
MSNPLTSDEISSMLPTVQRRTDQLHEGDVIKTEFGLVLIAQPTREADGWSILDHFDSGMVGVAANQVWEVWIKPRGKKRNH